jgi:hypothetical protein
LDQRLGTVADTDADSGIELWAVTLYAGIVMTSTYTLDCLRARPLIAALDHYLQFHVPQVNSVDSTLGH